MIKNYTTVIQASTSIAEIEQILTDNGATRFMKNIENKEIQALFFTINTGKKEVVFKLPCDVLKLQKAMEKLKRNGKLPGISKKKINDRKHIQNIAWRILKDWVIAQITIINIEMVQLDEIFLPYAYDPQKQMTLYETYQAGRLLLE